MCIEIDGNSVGWMIPLEVNLSPFALRKPAGPRMMLLVGYLSNLKPRSYMREALVI
jgi:hypothetical protein